MPQSDRAVRSHSIRHEGHQLPADVQLWVCPAECEQLLLHLPSAQLLALHVLGNLCSESVDAKANETKECIWELGGLSALLPHCEEDDPTTLMYALGALQNLRS